MIPNDPLGRQWAQAALDRSHRARTGFDKVLLSLIVWGPDRRAKLLGTGFIVAPFGRQALAVSAAHNFDHAARVQTPWSVSHPTTLPEFTLSNAVPLDCRSLRAVYSADDTVEAAMIRQVSAVPEVDIAIFAIELRDEAVGAPFTHRIDIDSRVPTPGQEIVTLGYRGMEVLRDEPKEEDTRVLSFRIQPVLRRGVVTRVHPQGDRMRWPSFETTVPVEAGMSGGPVLWYDPDCKAGAPVSACGMISRDFSCDEATMSCQIAGCSTIAMLWPALGLPLWVRTAPDQVPERLLLHELIRRGIVQDPGHAASDTVARTEAGLTVGMVLPEKTWRFP